MKRIEPAQAGLGRALVCEWSGGPRSCVRSREITSPIIPLFDSAPPMSSGGLIPTICWPGPLVEREDIASGHHTNISNVRENYMAKYSHCDTDKYLKYTTLLSSMDPSLNRID